MKQDRNNLRYILYARKSSEDRDKQVQSIPDQLDVLRKLAMRLKINVVKELEDSKSAKTPFLRDGFTQMLKMLELGEADGILCWHINRLSRNPTESGILQQMLQDEKIKSIQAHDKEHLPDDNAVVFSVEASIGNQYILELRKNVKRGIYHKLRNGELSGVAPEGYLNVTKRSKKEVVKDPIRSNLVRDAFDLLLSGKYTVPEIRRIMNEDWGYTTVRRTKVGGGPINRSSLYGMFRNIRYAGQIPDPEIPGVYAKASFPAMISLDEYDRVQDILGKRGCPRLASRRQFDLRGFIRCGECGCMITAELKKKKLVNGEINYHTYYHCTLKKPCSQRSSVREADLFAQVNELLDCYEVTPKLYEWGIKALNEMAKEEISERDEVQSMQFESIAAVQKKLDNLLDMAEFGAITPEVYQQRSTKLAKELKERQKEQSKTADRVKNWYEIVGKTLETLTNANEKFVTGNVNDKVEILLAIGQNPILIDKKLVITPNEWLIPIKNEVQALRNEIEKVRTEPHKIQKASEDAILKSWYTRQDSNL